MVFSKKSGSLLKWRRRRANPPGGQVRLRRTSSGQLVRTAGGSVTVWYYFDIYVFVPGLGGGAAVYLEADDALLFDGLVGFGVIDRLVSIHPQLYSGAGAANDVLVPVMGLEDLVELFGVGSGEDSATSSLVVEAGPKPLSHVGLVSDHVVVVRDATAANLNAGVGGGGVADELYHEAEFKIPIDLLCAEEFILWEGFFQVAAYDCTILYAEVVEITFPSVEGPAVEQRYGARLVRCASAE